MHTAQNCCHSQMDIKEGYRASGKSQAFLEALYTCGSVFQLVGRHAPATLIHGSSKLSRLWLVPEVEEDT